MIFCTEKTALLYALKTMPFIMGKKIIMDFVLVAMKKCHARREIVDVILLNFQSNLEHRNKLEVVNRESQDLF